MRRQAIARPLALLAAGALAAACGGSGDAIDREVFIAAWVDLRVAALESDDLRLPPDRREAILARHGIDQEALLGFADVHGRDVEFMNGVWSEVERLLEERRPGDAQ
jgi:hypothetical protein